jgi:serine phosphatase RsbU (regulator of sigma subunit)
VATARPDRRRSGLAGGIAVGLLLLIVFTAFSLHLAEDAVRSQAEARVSAAAQLGARLMAEQSLRFEETVGAYATRLSSIAAPSRARLAPGDRAAAERVLDDMLHGGVEGIDTALLTDPLGRAVAVAPAGRIPLQEDLSGREWYRGVTHTHRAYLSRAYRSAAPGRPKVTTAAVPVRARGGAAVGILAASDRSRTQRLADDLGAQTHATFTITDQAGTIVARTGARGDRLVSLARDALVAQALRGTHGVQVRDVAGRRTVSGYAPVPGTGWTVTADVPTSQAFSDIPRLRWYMVAAAATVAFLVLWLIPLLVSRLGRAREALGVSEAFQSDLLPSVLPAGVRSHYVASERRMLLGGDFLDAVTTPDGGLAVCIGDVCGHGPRAAALGATLRAGWRTMASTGHPVDRLDVLDRLVESERRHPDHFATLACAVIPPGGDRIRFALAGHPPLVLATDGDAEALDGRRGPALGLGARDDQRSWPVAEHLLEGDDWALALYTDGLIEARTERDGGRLGLAGLLALASTTVRDARVDTVALLDRVAALGDASDSEDDVALVVVDGAQLAAAARRGGLTAAAGG